MQAEAIADPAEVRVVTRRTSEVTNSRDLAAADAGYRDKYRQHGAIVEHLEQDEQRSATLQVGPA